MELTPDLAAFAGLDPASPGEESGWTALVLAGERPGGDPMASTRKVPMKALIRVQGMTLLDHVITALLEVDRIKRVVVLAQATDLLASSDPLCLIGDKRLTLVRSGKGIAASIEAIAGTAPAPWPVLVTTADNALLTPGRIEMFLDRAKEASTDIAIGVGTRAIVEGRYPQTKRRWLKFLDGHFSGTNLFALANPNCLSAVRKWSESEMNRKKGLKLIASFGPALLFRVLTRTITFAAAIERVAARLGCTARPIVLDAEAPIDVGKPADLELVERILADRAKTLADERRHAERLGIAA